MEGMGSLDMAPGVLGPDLETGMQGKCWVRGSAMALMAACPLSHTAHPTDPSWHTRRSKPPCPTPAPPLLCSFPPC